MPKKKENLSPEERLAKAIIPKEEEPYKVPDNWVWTKIKEVNEVVTGNTPSKKVQDYWENRNINFVKPSDLYQKRNLNFSEEYIDNRAKEKVRLIPKYSTILCCIGSIGKSSFIEIECCTNQQINSLVPKLGLNALYNYYYSTSSFFINQMKNSSSATTIAILNKSKTEDLLFPLAPFDEQKRIVEKLDSLFEKTGKIKEIIEEVKEKTSLRKEAVLSKAFTGELTEKWRAENKTENAKELLLKINEEKLRNNTKAKIKDISEMLVNEDEIPYKIPENWVWTRLGDITEKNQYGYTAKAEQNGKIKYLRITDIQDNKVNWKTVPFCSIDERDLEKFKLKENDIVVTRTGATTGKSFLIESINCEAVFASYLIRVRALNGLPKFLWNYMKANLYWKQITEFSSGIAQPGVNAQKLENLLFPLPPLEEQKEIVRILDKVFEEEDKISELISIEEKVEILEKTILDKAFRGELGTGNIDDEPALELLKKTIEIF